MAQDDVVSLFTELASVPSPPGDERAVADSVAAYMRDLGLDVSEDDAGARIGSNAGNLYARVEATDGGTPLFLCAHLDTVPPEAGIEPVLEDGVIRNAAGTILGADNKSAVAVMLEATRADSGREPAARRARAALHAEGGGRVCTARPRSTTSGCTRGSGTSTTRPRRSAR